MNILRISQLLTVSCLSLGLLFSGLSSIQSVDACPMKRSNPLHVKNDRRNTTRELRVAQDAFRSEHYARAYSAYRKVWRKLHGEAQAEALHHMAISAQEAGIKSGALTAARFLVRVQPENGMGYLMLAAALQERADDAGRRERSWATAKARQLGITISDDQEAKIFVARL